MSGVELIAPGRMQAARAAAQRKPLPLAEVAAAVLNSFRVLESIAKLDYPGGQERGTYTGYLVTAFVNAGPPATRH